MVLKLLKDTVRKVTDPLEVGILGNDYFTLQKSLGYSDKLRLIWNTLQLRAPSQSIDIQPEITFLLYSNAGKRLLLPLIFNLLKRPEIQEKGIKVNVILLFGIHRLTLSDSDLQKLQTLKCQVQTDYFSLIRACHQPEQKLVICCLDHRRAYTYHFWGVDAVSQLQQCGVKTLSIQHAGTRADSVEDLASAVSHQVLLWGKRVYREITETYGGDPKRFRIVGAPVHDRLAALDHHQAQQQFIQCYPEVGEQLAHKRVVLVATCLHTEYRGRGDETQMYLDYMDHIYKSLDLSKVLLLVKMHPNDTLDPNLYSQAIPDDESKASIVIVEPTVSELDIYSLLSLSELLITRASTVAEEAMLMGKKVISFDLLKDGPSQNYKHLEEYGSYTTTYTAPEDALKTAVDAALFGPPSEQDQQLSLIEEDLTHALDGHSADRAVDEILDYFLTP